jgi:hypothetical protein
MVELHGFGGQDGSSSAVDVPGSNVVSDTSNPEPDIACLLLFTFTSSNGAL